MMGAMDPNQDSVSNRDPDLEGGWGGVVLPQPAALPVLGSFLWIKLVEESLTGVWWAAHSDLQ